MKDVLKREQEWTRFTDEGAQFLATAVNAVRKRRKVFTPDILYNLIAMSMEKYIMGYLLYRKNLPDNHTLGDLMDALKRVDQIENDLCERIIRMDRFQEICCITTYSREIPDEKDIEEMLTLGERIRDFVNARMPTPIPAGR
ncbi:MAG: hypothetical protein ACOCW9_05200 [Thermodesulfobacteriota bacterium]